METQILRLLQVSKNEYELTIFSNYIRWCKKYESNDLEAQRLYTSQALFSWWLSEYRKLEARFIELAIPYKNHLSKDEMQSLHLKETLDIHTKFCKPLIYTAKHKRQVINGNPLAN